MIQFSPQQDQALTAIKKWYGSESYAPFVLNGFAGTGKTTIAKYMPDIIGAHSQSEVIYVAFTGKAAQQLERKGCNGATTAHKLLYAPVDKSKKRLMELTAQYERLLLSDPHERREATKAAKREMKEERKLISGIDFINSPDEDRLKDAKLIVVDESSMIDNEIHYDLMALGKPIIYCGDPFQLPPVKGVSPVSNLKPDIMLTEVHRQALDNPILRAATLLRAEQKFDVDPHEDRYNDMSLTVGRWKDASYELYDSHDQIICGRNKTRNSLNQKFRTRKIDEGKVENDPKFPIGKGDRIIFLRNDYEEYNFFNGTMGTIKAVDAHPNPNKEHNVLISGYVDGDGFENYDCWVGLLNGRHKTEMPTWDQSVDLAYAITCHKSQGSEWDSVLVHYENLWGSDPARWLYTALTRARLRCTVMTRGKL